ncbi:MAG: SPOR domain-containing protein [Methylobacillus sp.]|jgi:DedD protein|nr:SPOR domain-containing protein [Methylobacillus sp.]
MAIEKLSEQEIQLRKRARRRLVGAIALVLAMVVILPMVLDDRETKAPQPEIVVSIPSQDGEDFTSRVGAATENGATENTATQNPPQTATPETAVTPEETIPDSEAAPVSTAETKPAPTPVKPEPTKPEAAKPDKKPAANAATTFTIQIGVFSDANLKQMQKKLTDAGYKSYTEKLNGNSGTRLRVGSYATRAEAEKVLEKLKAAGTDGMVVPK